jgi:hypothetical protein
VKEHEWDSTNKFLIKRCHNGLSIRHRNPNNPDMFMDTVIENKDDDLKYTFESIWFLIDLLDLEYEDIETGRRIEINLVEKNQVDCDNDMN